MRTIRIRLSPKLCQELADCEEGAYSDALPCGELGERPISNHAHVVASEGVPRGALTIRNAEQAEDMYYAVCSGLFKARTLATLTAATRIANTLRPFANHGTVKRWPRPEPEDFIGM
jgi:hypothetical protein